MKEHYVTYKQAVKLKELGFEGNGLKHYIHQGYYKVPNGYISPIKHDGDGILVQFRKEDAERIPAPRLDQAQKWLREVKGIDIEITTVLRNPTKKTRCYMANLAYFSKDIDGNDCGNYIRAGIDIYSYEKALELGISEALELLTNKP